MLYVLVIVSLLANGQHVNWTVNYGLSQQACTHRAQSAKTHGLEAVLKGKAICKLQGNAFTAGGAV